MNRPGAGSNTYTRFYGFLIPNSYCCLSLYPISCFLAFTPKSKPSISKHPPIPFPFDYQGNPKFLSRANARPKDATIRGRFES
ncbi:hypothetical protein GQ457_11G005050 [Hibiscus cannabinus]